MAIDRPPPTLMQSLAEARAFPPARALSEQQSRLLTEFAKLWNKDRAERGLNAFCADDALTEGLEALIAMLEQK